MSSATTTQNHAGQYRRGLFLSALVHLLLLLALSSSLILLPNKPITSRAINAFVVDQNSLKQSTAIKERPPQPVAAKPPPQEPEPKQQQIEQQPQQEAERKELERKAAEAEAERKVQERKAAETRRKAEADRQKEQERKAAEAKAEADRKAQERKAAEEAQAKAEAERQAQQQKAQEAARRQAELAAAMAAEEDLLAAQRSGEMDIYISRIQQAVERKWVPPASAQMGLECEVAVVQLPSGDVVNAQTVRCNGDAAVQRSIEAAVMAASPLPRPDNPALFERNLRFIFKPQQ
jgi:colicin import membrane protein